MPFVANLRFSAPVIINIFSTRTLCAIATVQIQTNRFMRWRIVRFFHYICLI